MNEIKDAEIITEDSITEEIVDNNVTLAEEASSLNDIVELTNEQQAEMSMMELIKKDLYPTINNEEKELLDKYDILKTGMAGINKAVEDVYKGELSKFVEKILLDKKSLLKIKKAQRENINKYSSNDICDFIEKKYNNDIIK